MTIPQKSSHQQKWDKSTKVTVFGAGSWGSTVANLIAGNVDSLMIWARDAEVVESINSRKTNDRFLPGLDLSPNLSATTDYGIAAEGSDVIIWAIPVQFTRARLRDCGKFFSPNAVLLNLSKGFEENTLCRPSQIIRQECPQLAAVGSLGGPNIANEIARGLPAHASLALEHHWEYSGIEKLLTTSSFRVELCPDIVSVEICGAIKNIVAIAAGVCDGYAGGDNMKSAVVAKGFSEIAQVVAALGGNPSVLGGPFGLGDLLTTCYSRESRNRTLGQKLGEGLSLDESVHALNGRVAEGIATTRAWNQLSDMIGLDLPLMGTVSDLIAGQLDPADFLRGIFADSTV